MKTKKKTRHKNKTVKHKNKIKKINKIFVSCKWPKLCEQEKTEFATTPTAHGTYGYITPEGLTTLLKGLRKQGRTFYDLGSGIGRPAVSVAMLFPQIEKIVGIEMSNQRHKESERILATLPECYKSKITFIHKNFLHPHINLKDADIIWTSSLCFPQECLEQLGKKIDTETKPGTYVFSSKALIIPRATLTKIIRVKQSWKDDSKVHCYKIK